MRLRTSPIVLTALACTVSGTMALTATTAFASSTHGSHNSTSHVKVKGNCNVVGNNNNVHCTTISHSHRSHGHGGFEGGGFEGGGFGGDRFGHGGILEGVGDIVGGLLGAL